LQDMSNFLFISMTTGPKVAQRIQVVLFCFKKQLCWDYFAFIRTQLVEVIIWQVQYAETIGWVCLGFRIKAYGQVLGLGVQGLELGFSQQLT